ncbi:MAG: hypothetical protein GF418_17155 [Chitinivibrionales bacterium]|nr:hypothetical protein [Chitinivibrionales bacterium]MBD3397348.1 hypothetical protein [Chitinivibrionales bacterium]
MPGRVPTREAARVPHRGGACRAAALAVLVLTAPGAARTKIACVGNSITEGCETFGPGEHRYPAHLDGYFDTNFVVVNFGVAAQCVLKKSDEPYWYNPIFPYVFEFQPDTITIMLGTNDSKPQNWAHKKDFARDVTALVDTFASMETNPDIWLCLPPPAFENFIYQDINGEIIHDEIVPLIRQVAVGRGIPLIDTHTPLLDHEDYFPDGVHPNPDGASELAAIIAASLKAGMDIRHDGLQGPAVRAVPRDYPVLSLGGAVVRDARDFRERTTVYTVLGRRLGIAGQRGKAPTDGRTVRKGLAVWIAREK